MNLQSEEEITDVCSHFRPLSSSNNVIKGHFQCSGGVGNPKTLNGGSSSNNGGSSSSSSESPNAANHRYISGPMGVMGVIAAIFGML